MLGVEGVVGVAVGVTLGVLVGVGVLLGTGVGVGVEQFAPTTVASADAVKVELPETETFATLVYFVVALRQGAVAVKKICLLWPSSNVGRAIPVLNKDFCTLVEDT